MNFKRMPDSIFLQIIHELPFPEQLRLARVNRRFKQMSKTAIEQMTELIFPQPDFRCKNVKPLKKMIHSCAPNLEQWQLTDTTDGNYNSTNSIASDLVDIVSTTPRHRLVELKLLILFDPTFRFESFRNLLINCPNLGRLELSSGIAENATSSNFKNPLPSTTCAKLTSVRISGDSDFVRWLLANCKNLISVCIHPSSESVTPFLPWKRVLHDVLQRNPGVRSFMWCAMTLGDPDHIQFDVPNLWRLESLRSLRVHGVEWPNKMLKKLSISLPRLHSLYLSARGDPPTEEGLIALSNLADLRHFMFQGRFYGRSSKGYSFDKAWNRMAVKCPNLEKVNVCYEMTPETLTNFITNCPRLRELQMDAIAGIESKMEAKQYLKSLKGKIRQQLIMITMVNGDGDVWYSKKVEKALAKLNDGSNGGYVGIYLPRCNREIKRWMAEEMTESESESETSEINDDDDELGDQEDVMNAVVMSGECNVSNVEPIIVESEPITKEDEPIAKEERPVGYVPKVINWVYDVIRMIFD